MTDRFAFLRRPASLSLRVTGLVGIAMLVVFLIFSWVSLRLLDRHFAGMDEEELGVIASSVIRALSEVQDGSDAQALRRAVRGHHGVYYHVADATGKALYEPKDGPDLARFAHGVPSATVAAGQDMTIWEEDGRTYRGGVIVAGGDGELSEVYTIAVAMDIGGHLDFIRSFRRIQWWIICGAMCIVILMSWFAVRWGHIPIRRANDKVRAITSSKLYLRLDPTSVPIELEETIASFNDMLGRVEDGFEQLANFSADIAHELRTPVTNVMTQTEVALGQARSAAEYREVLYSNLEEFGRLNRTINDMLFLAQTENDPGNLNLESVNLKETVLGLFDYFEALVEEREVKLEIRGPGFPVHADREMLRRALSNLISNAIRYTASGETITVRLSQTDRDAVISVENPGEKVPPEELSRIFNRFYRASGSAHRKGEGAGLGLAIVKSIVEAHGGSVSALSDERLTKFHVLLPSTNN